MCKKIRNKYDFLDKMMVKKWNSDENAAKNYTDNQFYLVPFFQFIFTFKFIF